MQQINFFGVGSVVLLAGCLIGYAIYELILYPNAGFSTSDVAVIIVGADTLPVGHWLK